MSDTEDHLEHEDRPGATTEEEKPINFEWTPELVKIGTSRGDIHPSIVPHKIHEKGYRDYTYRPGMTLPDPADTRECLRWIGLSDKKIFEVERKFNQLYPDFQVPSCGYDNKVSTEGISDITFPLIEGMVDLFMQGVCDDKEDDYDYTTYSKYLNLIQYRMLS